MTDDPGYARPAGCATVGAGTGTRRGGRMRRALITGIAGQDGSDIGLLDDELAGRLVRIDRP